MNRIELIIIVFFCTISCTSIKKNKVSNYTLTDSNIIDTLNLSNKGLSEMPNLINYQVKYLDLSNNNISNFKEEKLPKKVLELDLSNNLLKGKVIVNHDYKSINFSSNKIDTLYVHDCIDYIDLSNNNLNIISFDCFIEKSMSVLDISNNKQLSSELRFNPLLFKKIIRKNIKDRDPLRWSLEGIIKN